MGFWSDLSDESKSGSSSDDTAEKKKKSDKDEELENRARKVTDYVNSSRISSEHIDSINNQTVRPDDPNSPLKYNIHSDDPRSAYADPGRMARNKADTFSSGKTVKDHYTGETLTSNQREAVEQYGTDWQNHASETDHINSVDEMYQDHKDDIWLGRDDLKKVINSDKNFQQLSKSNNAAKKNLSPKEYADKLYEDGKISKQRRDRIIKDAEKSRDDLEWDIKVEKAKNIAGAFNDAGCAAAAYSAETSAVTGALTSLIDLAQGNKVDIRSTLVNISKNSAKSAASSYITSGSLTVINRTLSKCGNQVLQYLGNCNAAGKALMAVQVAGDSIMKLLNHEISLGEATERIAKNASQVAIVGETTAIGQLMIPIPVVGAAVGSLCGMIICKGLMGFFEEQKQKRIRQQERQQLQSQYQQISELLDQYTRQYEEFARKFNLRKAEFYGNELVSIEEAYVKEDYAAISTSCQTISTALTGKKAQCETLDDFFDFLDS